MGKFFAYKVKDGKFWYEVKKEVLEQEEALDGCYVVTTNVGQDELTKEEAVERYKSLRQVEQDFRTMKRGLLKIEPIRHHLPQRVKAGGACPLALPFFGACAPRTCFKKNFYWNTESIFYHLGMIREEINLI